MASTAVATTSGPPSTRTTSSGNRTYVITNAQYSSTSGGNAGNSGGGAFSRRAAATSRVLGSGAVRANVPAGLPRFLGNQRTVVYAWVGAMGVIFVDEWHNNKILARPARLWWTSLVYGILAMLGAVESLIPLANAFALGFLIMLLWQYYNKTGQFSE